VKKLSAILFMFILFSMLKNGLAQDIKPERIQSDQLKQTAVTSYLQDNIVNGKNLLYCSTFQIAWNALCDDIIKEPLQLKGNPLIAQMLNKRLAGKEDISEDCYLSMAGFNKDGIVEKIKQALKEKFNETPGIDISLTRPDDILSYAFLLKDLKFKKDFESLDKPIMFNGNIPVQAFGIKEYAYDEEHMSLGEQVSILYPEKTVKKPIFVMSSTMAINKFSTNLCNFELVYSFEGLIKEFLMGIPLRQLELISSSSVNQTSRQGKQISAQSMQSSRVPLLWQTETFEPVDQIVSQQNQMKMNLIGQETVGRNIAQGEAFFEFSDIQFASGPGFVKMPYVFRFEGKIGNKGMVKVILEFPECELTFFFLGFWFGAAHYDEAMRSLPIVRLVSKLSRLPAFLMVW